MENCKEGLDACGTPVWPTGPCLQWKPLLYEAWHWKFDLQEEGLTDFIEKQVYSKAHLFLLHQQGGIARGVNGSDKAIDPKWLHIHPFNSSSAG